ncbi:universal stress protein [Candidatus Deferrimicrobium sp.]|uniref:universal stress protein n=1 Tax=Candidatus Deferrimicrobium sp. TaxID=3060586 RepID=UPI002ECFEC9B
MNDIRRIMVVAADIKHSGKSVRMGVSLAERYDAALVVLHVEHDPFGEDGWNLPFLSVEEEYKALLKEEKKNLAEVIRSESVRGLPVKEMIRKGEPIGVIRKVVEEEKIDLLLLPAHEEGRFEHLLYGNINSAIIRRMPCSILLVKQETGA